ncbi:7594_t:CDS:2 [Rhizophagus irregularis]|nr:7594_t:CDS:2 [Rhizophagus irregularis]
MKNKVQAVSDTKVDELPTEDKVIDTTKICTEETRGSGFWWVEAGHTVSEADKHV